MVSEFQLLLYCRDPSQESFDKVRKFVEAGVNVHSRGRYGANALMCAAVGFERVPNARTFFYLFNQQEQPLDLDEKIDGLELLGASYILNKEYVRGLAYWLEACQLRTTPKVCTIPTSKPSRPFVKCEWTTRDDVIQLRNTVTNGGSNIDLFYQAMLVRVRLIDWRSEEHSVCLSMYALDYINSKDYPRYFECVLFCLEHVQIHGGSCTSHISLIVRRTIYELSLMASSDDHRRRNLCTFAVNMAIFDWIVTELDKLKRLGDNNRYTWGDFFLDCAVQLLVVLTGLPKTESEDFQLKKRSYDLVKLNVRNTDGFNSLLLACCSSSQLFKWHRIPDISYSPLPSMNVVELLIEVGEDPNSADNEGNSALHVLAMSGLLNDEPALVELLLTSGVHWDGKNRRNLEPFALWSLNPAAIDNDKQLVAVPLAFRKSMSLKCLCAKAIHRYYSNTEIKQAILPGNLKNFVLAH